MHDVNETDTVSAVSDDDARGELARVISNIAFQQAPRLRQLLEYLVHETLNGRASRIKGFTIAQEVFGRDDPEDAQTSTVVSVQARRLRRRLDDYYAGDGKNNPVRIRIPKGAYVPVFESNSVADTADASFAAAGSRPSDPPRRMGDFRLPLAVLAVVVVAVGLIWLSQSLFLKPTTPLQEAGKLSIAVMPFRNLTDEPGNDPLAMGLTEEIITDLSKLSGIDIIAFSSVLPFHGKAITPQGIGKDLAVTHSLQGSIRGTKPNFRVTAELAETKSGKHIWTKRFDQRLDDEIAFQDQLARKIAEELSSNFTKLEDANFEERPVADPEAYALYKQSLRLFIPQSDAGRNNLSRQAFEQVIEMVPNFAGGYAGLAYTYAFAAFFGHSVSPDADAEKAMDLAEKAISIDDHHALAYSAKAYANLVHRNFDAALAASTNAITLQPSAAHSTAVHGFLLVLNGQAARGADYAKRALRLDPLAVRAPYLNILSIAQFHNGEYENALQTMLRNAERGGPQGPAPQAYLAAIYAVLGRPDEARATFHILNRRQKTFDWESWIRRNFRYERDTELVLRLLRELAAK